MDPRLPGCLTLAAAAMLACTSGYNTGTNSYPGGGAAGGVNGSYGNGGGTGGNGASGGYTAGGTGGGASTGGNTTTGASSSSSGGTLGGSSSGGTTGANPNQLSGPLAFTVASAAEFLPVVPDGGAISQIEFELSSFVIDCSGTGASPAGLTLTLDLFSGSPTVAVMSGPTYVFTPPSGSTGIPYASATLFQTDGQGNATVVATGQSGPVSWAPRFDGTPSGTLVLTMISTSNNTVSNLSGTFVAPFCGNL